MCMAMSVSAQEASVPYNAAQLRTTWEVVENNHQGKTEFLSALTFVNTGRTALPAKGWQLYFNFIRSVNPGRVKGNLEVSHINGDLYKLVPAADFAGVAPGDSLRVELVGDAWAVNFTDAPSGLYIVWDQQPEKGYSITNYSIRPSTQPKQYLRFPGDKTGLITPVDIYNQNKTTRDLPAASLPPIFPSPVSYQAGSGTFTLTSAAGITTDAALQQSADYLAGELARFLGKRPAIDNGGNSAIRFKVDATLAAPAYELEITPQNIIISASSNEGAFYAIQSLNSLITPVAWAGVQKSISMPALQVKDAPRFGYRAFMIDVARNFHSKRDILRLLDVMATYKLNVLHFHLNDDEGWRLDIPALPELAQVGGKRGHSTDANVCLPPSYGSGPDTANNAGTGYYTRQDFIEILKYATARHIRVIPEIESPGHARAAVKAMDARYNRLMKAGNKEAAEEYVLSEAADKSEYRSVQYWNDNVMNVALPSVYRFMDKVVEEMQQMYKEAGIELTTVHMGGDEVPGGAWEKSPACLALMAQDKSIENVNDLWYYYYRKLHTMLKAKGIQLAGWEEAGMRKTKINGENASIPNPDFVNDNFQVNVWNNVIGGGAEDLAYRMANAGYKVVLSGVSNFYFDMAYMKSFDEPGFYWGGFVDVDKPFYFIPLDYYKNSKVDATGNPVTPELFVGKDKLTAYGASNTIGIQGLLWSETVNNPQRMEYMILPKLLGLAERAWAQDPAWATEKDAAKSEKMYEEAWSVFANVLGKRELPRLAYMNGGYNYRIPTAGAVIENGVLKANIQLPGFVIRYTTDGKEPSLKSKAYTGPVPVNGKVKLKVFDVRGRSSRSVEVKAVPVTELKTNNLK